MNMKDDTINALVITTDPTLSLTCQFGEDTNENHFDILCHIDNQCTVRTCGTTRDLFCIRSPYALDANTVLHGISQATVRATNSFGAAISIEIMVPLSSFV